MKPYISAYPQIFTKDDSGNFHQPMDKNEAGSGMSLRDYLAGQALVSNKSEFDMSIETAADFIGINIKEYKYEVHYPKIVAVMSYKIADAMLEERKKDV